MKDFIPLLIIPIGLLIAIILSKTLMWCIYCVIYMQFDYKPKEDKGYQKWKEKYIKEEDNGKNNN